MTVWTQDGCVKCKATIRAFRKMGSEPEVVDITSDDAAREWLIDQGYLSLPVVWVSGDGWEQWWSDHQPTMIEKVFK